jgi:hypothetical protein
MFSFDLAYGGGPLAPAATPTTAPMNQFAMPRGVTNPAGYGGTPSGNALLQIGGAQNTIKNTIAPVPNGTVVLGVAQPGQPAVLATGTITIPNQVGPLSLSVSSVFANVIVAGQSGNPFWKVAPATVGTVTNLSIEVGAITASTPTVSVTAGQVQTLQVDAGPQNAGRSFLMLGSLSGTSPGTVLAGGLVLPLNADGYFQYTRTHPNSAFLAGSFGTLDAQGRATVTFAPTRRFIGPPVHHAFLLTNPIDFVSEAEPCTVVD